MTTRAVVQSPVSQGKDETIAYTLTTTPWGSSPGSVAVVIYDYATGTYTTSTNLSGSASVNGDIITTPAVTALLAGHQYRLEIKFTCSGNIFEARCIINAED